MMNPIDEDRWFDHLSTAYATDVLTAEQHESDVEDVLHGREPSHFMRSVEGKLAWYGDSNVPIEWLEVAQGLPLEREWR